jgi:hypothetical protein
LGIGTSQNIEAAIALSLEVFGANQTSNLSVIVNLFKILPAGILLVLLIDQVKGSTCLILLSSVKLINFSCHTLFLELVVCSHLIEPSHLTV